MPPQDKATKYEYILPQLVAAGQDDSVEGLLVILNTPAATFEGTCNLEMIAGMSKPTVSLVLGGGHSIGIPLAVSADSFVYREKRGDDAASATDEWHGNRCNADV